VYEIPNEVKLLQEKKQLQVKEEKQLQEEEKRKKRRRYSIEIQTCRFEGCKKKGVWAEQKGGYVKGGKQVFCSDHKRPTDIHIKKEPVRCRAEGCEKTPSFGKLSNGTRMFCSKHKREGDIDLTVRFRCTAEGCNKKAMYGSMMDCKKIFCFAHKGPRDTNLTTVTKKRKKFNPNENPPPHTSFSILQHKCGYSTCSAVSC